ncbi:uncharacterized protein LOC116162081 [Photinus pyralis]|uniref:Haemolymph juvenile hormone binding protein n=1 Tax=Photinus pyralis TaxID=7054 RepID=A0A1Y1JU37_PHOPY|nr:uncharacterized protein LOC116162081 [Photinus pyralis]
MTMRSLIFLSAVLMVRGEIPPYIKVCEHTVQNLSACIIDSIEFLRPKLVEGIPELDVPSMEPLPLADLRIASIGSGSRLATNLTDVKVYGASKFEIQKLEVTLAETVNTFQFHVNIPKVRVEAHYQLDSRILFLDVKGEGPFFANITNYWFDCTMKGDKVDIEGKNYLFFEHMTIKVVVGHVSILLGNIFDGNPALSKATNDVINDNALLIFDEIKPALVEKLEEVFTEMANKITLKFEYEALFP